MQAFEEAKAEIEKNKPPEDPNRKPKKKPAEEGGGGGEGGGGAPAAAGAPVPGDDLGLDEAGKEERLGKNGKLTVHLASASGLKSADKSGLSDPYVEAKLGKKSKKSKVCNKTLSPTWDEQLELATKLSLKKCVKDGLLLIVSDKDTGMMDSDDVIGKVTAKLDGLATSGSVSFNEAIPEGGVLTFSVEWVPEETVDRTVKKKAKKDKDKDVSQTV